MARLVMLASFRSRATPPEGDPPSLTVHGESEEITPLAGSEGAAPPSATYETVVRMTGQTTFVESGTITFGDEGSIRVDSVGGGTISPSAEEGAQHGSVIWRVEEGRGRFDGASGLVTSNFRVSAEAGDATDHEVLDHFLP
jgi:hypothetical protein